MSKLLPIVVKAFPRAKMIKDRIPRDDIPETLRSRVPAVSNAALTRTRKRFVRALDSPNFPIIVLLRSGMMTKRRIRVMEGRMARTEFAYGDIRYEPRIRTSADRFGGAVCNS